MDKREFVLDIAKNLILNNNKMYAQDLVALLNNNNFKTNRNEHYVGGIGIFKLISSIYKWLEVSNRDADAELIAKAFVDAKGEYAYQR